MLFDELDRLRANPSLFELLSHYAALGRDNRETWQDRLLHLEGVELPGLVKLHGELIAFGWIEQNTGHVPTAYRITSAGLKAMRQIQKEENEDYDPPIENPNWKKAA